MRGWKYETINHQNKTESNSINTIYYNIKQLKTCWILLLCQPCRKRDMIRYRLTLVEFAEFTNFPEQSIKLHIERLTYGNMLLTFLPRPEQPRKQLWVSIRSTDMICRPQSHERFRRTLDMHMMWFVRCPSQSFQEETATLLRGRSVVCVIHDSPKNLLKLFTARRS